jgi:hypothetical protein
MQLRITPKNLNAHVVQLYMTVGIRSHLAGYGKRLCNAVTMVMLMCV